MRMRIHILNSYIHARTRFSHTHRFYVYIEFHGLIPSPVPVRWVRTQHLWAIPTLILCFHHAHEKWCPRTPFGPVECLTSDLPTRTHTTGADQVVPAPPNSGDINILPALRRVHLVQARTRQKHHAREVRGATFACLDVGVIKDYFHACMF